MRVLRASGGSWAVAGCWEAIALMMVVGAAAQHIDWPIAAWLLVATATSVRLLRMGVYDHDDALVSRSWFTSRTVPIAVIRGLRLGAYSGLAYRASESWFLRVVVIELERGREVALPQSVGLRTEAGRQQAVLERYLSSRREPGTAGRPSGYRGAFEISAGVRRLDREGPRHSALPGADGTASPHRRRRTDRALVLSAFGGALLSSGLLRWDTRWAIVAAAFLALGLGLWWWIYRRGV